MRTYILAIAATVICGSPAFAQSAPAPAVAPAMMKLFSAGADIPALIAKAKADRKGDAPAVFEPILALAPYEASLEYRPLVAPAALHEKDAEIMYVLEGTGTIVTGGKLVGEKRSNAANLNGTSIADGKSQTVVKGDVLIIPENTPHQVLPGGGAPIVVMTLHVPRPAPANWP
jgi:mannose-6-phosphate isomerase-like protein (cupin superfamily)